MNPDLLEALRQRTREKDLEVHEDAIIAQALPAVRLTLERCCWGKPRWRRR